nr:mitochondrial fission ELM1 family protein [uncultured Lichenicoccus sp.]
MEPDPAVILAQPYAGLEAQARGLAHRAGLLPSVHALVPRRPWSWLPAARWPAPLHGVAPLGPLPDGLVLGVGGVAAAVGAALRRQGRRVVQIQNPRMRFDRFDLVVANTHDEIAGPNVLLSRNALHRVGPEVLAAARAVWAQRLAHLPRPLVAVLVGGSNGRFRLDAPTGQALAAQLAAMMRSERVGLALTPSRRTSPDVRLALQGALSPLGAWVWGMQGDNPYFGLLACADAIVVTADSVSMVSEAAATTVPVLVAPLPGRSRRIGLFLRTLQQAGRIRMFDGRLQHWQAAALDDTPAVAHEMRRRLGYPDLAARDTAASGHE